MGRQINFYLHNEDERNLLESGVFSNIVFLNRLTDNPKNNVYKEFHLIPREQTKNTQLYVCLEEDLDNIVYMPINSSDLYFVEPTLSHVIEFIRSGLNPEKNILVSGRFWYEHKYWTKNENGEYILVEKSKELEKLYNNLAGWIRRHCDRMENGNYIGPNAKDVHKKGTRLSM